jgi:hypothetical protein
MSRGFQSLPFAFSSGPFVSHRGFFGFSTIWTRCQTISIVFWKPLWPPGHEKRGLLKTGHFQKNSFQNFFPFTSFRVAMKWVLKIHVLHDNKRNEKCISLCQAASNAISLFLLYSIYIYVYILYSILYSIFYFPTNHTKLATTRQIFNFSCGENASYPS